LKHEQDHLRLFPLVRRQFLVNEYPAEDAFRYAA
jgi:hypothetical protein